jgi:hypothetical protein
MKIKLEEEVVAQKTLPVLVRPALHALKCDGCGEVFDMKEFCNDTGLGQLGGTFEKCAEDETGRGLGNTFSATVCSFQCAHEVFANGGWRKMPHYKPFADADIRLVRAKLQITAYVLDEGQIRTAWQAVDHTPDGSRTMPYDLGDKWVAIG